MRNVLFIVAVLILFAGIISSSPALLIKNGQSNKELKKAMTCTVEKQILKDVSQQSVEDELVSLEVDLKVLELTPFKYLIKVLVKNLENKRITLGIGLGSGFVVYNENDEEIYRKPGYFISILRSLTLRPHHSKILYVGIWDMRWCQESTKYSIYGCLDSYEYNGKTYPPIMSEPKIIYPPVVAFKLIR